MLWQGDNKLALDMLGGAMVGYEFRNICQVFGDNGSRKLDRVKAICRYRLGNHPELVITCI